ncbi:hypothetical protein V6M85_05940 [Sulfolobus tengchongensis]|uniref:Uncharacterized protein n=1 Tax=Sulfolobus tengchongensis TaxID=207809 RepID=A0AAX4L5K1_9CREN
MTLESRPWRIGSDVWEKLDEICVKLKMKKSYNCTDTIIQNASDLIMEDINITDSSVKNALIGIKYLINSNIFYSLISNMNNDNSYKEIANLLLSFINGKTQKATLFLTENSDSCTERSLLENIIRSLVFILGDNVRLLVDGKTKFEIVPTTENPNIIKFLKVITEAFKENFSILELENSCDKDHICIKLALC